MIRGSLFAATALVLALGSVAPMAALADVAHDPRLVQHLYADNQVVRVPGRAGVQATIAFGRNESIENVAVGDSASWQITPNKRADLLFVKPLADTAHTNMTVVTNLHTYFFDLVASPRTSPLYLLRFTYKDADKAPEPGVVAPALAALSPQEQALMEGDRLAKPEDPAALNFAWKRGGTQKLWPARIYDDGQSTFLLWPEKSAVPAILIRNEKGDEGPVNYAVRGATIVIADVPQELILRSGKAVATLEHSVAADPVPAASGSSTSQAPRTARAESFATPRQEN